MIVQDQVERTIILLQAPIEGPGVRRRVYPCPSTPSFILFTNLAYNAQFFGGWHYGSVSTILVPLIHIRGVTLKEKDNRKITLVYHIRFIISENWMHNACFIVHSYKI